MEIYGVVIMDIVGSRKLLNRKAVQDSLIDFIDFINKKYAAILPIPISVTLGDEWQLITNEPWQCYNLIHEFQKLMWSIDVNFYAGIGIEKISTNLNNDIGKVDGPCFHLARHAINTVKDYYRQKKSEIHSKHNKIFFKGNLLDINNMCFFNKDYNGKNNISFNDLKEVEGEVAVDYLDNSMEDMNSYFTKLNIDSIINNIIENNEILKQKMTQKQKRVYIEYLKAGSYRKILDVEEMKDESISSISQKLNTAEFFTIQHNHKIVTSLLYNYCSQLCI